MSSSTAAAPGSSAPSFDVQICINDVSLASDDVSVTSDAGGGGAELYRDRPKRRLSWCPEPQFDDKNPLLSVSGRRFVACSHSCDG